MTTHTAPAPVDHDEWWEKLYADPADTHSRPVAAGSSRLPDWRKRETIPLGGADQAAAEQQQDDEPEAEPDEDQDEPEDEELPDDTADEPTDEPDTRPARPQRPLVEQLRDHRHRPHRLRVLFYNGTAAGAGWAVGLEPRCQQLITECGRQTHSTSAALTLGVGLIIAAALIVDRRTRHWWGPLPWILRIPLASAVLALALYTPNV